MTSAQGIDISAWQPAATVAQLAGLDFAFCKATDGTGWTDPYFAANWAAIRAAGLFRGAYHEQQSGDPTGQASHFLATVQAQGLVPGDMLAVSVSDYSVSDAEARTFLDAVRAGTGGRNPVIVYTDLSVAAGLVSCTGYPLWIAWPSSTAPQSVAPWGTWHLWQWGETGTDRDAFNGTPAEMDAWIASYAAPSPVSPSPSQEVPVQLPVLKQGDTGQAVRNWQGLLIAHGYGYMIAPDPASLPAGATVEAQSGIDGDYGPATSAATGAFRSAKGLAGGGADAKAWAAALA